LCAVCAIGVADHAGGSGVAPVRKVAPFDKPREVSNQLAARLDAPDDVALCAEGVGKVDRVAIGSLEIALDQHAVAEPVAEPCTAGVLQKPGKLVVAIGRVVAKPEVIQQG
jgi:hypothetical protein